MFTNKRTDKKSSSPYFDSEEVADMFVEVADFSKYDFSGSQLMQFEFEKKTTWVNIRMPEKLVLTIKAKVQSRGASCQGFIRETLEKALR